MHPRGRRQRLVDHSRRCKCTACEMELTPGASGGEGWGRSAPRSCSGTSGRPASFRCWGWRLWQHTRWAFHESGASVPTGETCPRAATPAASGSCGLHREEDQRAGWVSPVSDHHADALQSSLLSAMKLRVRTTRLRLNTVLRLLTCSTPGRKRSCCGRGGCFWVLFCSQGASSSPACRPLAESSPGLSWREGRLPSALLRGLPGLLLQTPCHSVSRAGLPSRACLRLLGQGRCACRGPARTPAPGARARFALTFVWSSLRACSSARLSWALFKIAAGVPAQRPLPTSAYFLTGA